MDSKQKGTENGALRDTRWDGQTRGGVAVEDNSLGAVGKVGPD